jgi:hypothetical protein
VKRVLPSDALLDTLGIGRFVYLSGAREFVLKEGSVSFKLPSNFAKKGINEITIQLIADALYDVSFSRVRKLARIEVFIDREVSSENVREVLAQRTGLRIS